MQKASIILFIFGFSFLLLTSCSTQSSDSPKVQEDIISDTTEGTISDATIDENSEYQEYYRTVSNFEKLKTIDLENDDFYKPSFIYFGRVSCPYCRKFVPVLDKISKDNNLTINYVDTEEVADNILDSFYIDEVPTLVYINQEGAQFKYDSNTQRSIEEWVSEPEK